MGGMRWNDGRVRLVDYCARTGVVYRKFDAEASRPAPVVYVGPSIVTAPPEEARAGEEYVYQASARDASTNGFTWSFVTPPPPGMEIDRYGGKITWTPTASCRVSVDIRAYTHHGRQVRQAWTIMVRKPAAVAKFAPNPRFIEALRRKALRTACRPRPGFAPAAGMAGAGAEPSPPDTGESIRAGPGRTVSRRCFQGTSPPPQRFWRGAWRITDGERHATAPPARPSGAPALPLRL